MITELALTDWKSHSSSSFSFGKGTNVLLGRMGAGKSSVLDALCFALYGTFPKMTRRDQSTESVVNIASGAEAAGVTLSFERAGKKYGIMRKVGKKTAEAEVRVDGKLVQKGAKQVTDYVTDALGVDYELFTRAIYSEQNRMDHLLSLTPRARKAEIDYLLGLGDFDTARDAAQSASGKLSEQSALLRADADPKKAEEASKKADDQRKEEKRLSESCTALGKRKLELAEKCRGASLGLAALEKARSEWRKRKTECDLLLGNAQRMERETEGKQRLPEESIARLATEQKALEGTLSSAKAEAKRLQISMSSAKSELAVVQKTIELAAAQEKKKAELERKLALALGGKTEKQMDGELAALKADAEKLSAARALLIAEADELEKAAHTLHKAGAKCPVCDSALAHGIAEEMSRGKKSGADDKKAKADVQAKEIAAKKTGISLLEKTLADARLCTAQLERLKSDSIDAQALEAKKKTAQEQSAMLEATAKAADVAIAMAEKSLDGARKAHEDAVRTEKLFCDFEAVRKKQADAQSALSLLAFDEEKYEAARKASEELSVSLARVESDFSGEERRLELVASLREVLESEVAAMKGKALLAGKYASAAQEMAIYKNSLSAAQSELRNTLVEEINEALAEVWPAIYPYADYDAVKIEADEKDYRLLMHKEGWREVDSVASGGERACLCLSLRIAFATVLTPDIGWLILDEPTHNLDSEAVALLAEAINQKIPSIVEQTFVITHDPALGESAEGSVFRLERDKSKGESTRVEKI
ncbi:MAG: SMC family ATPase [Candidatus Micrarchaeia archaeon]|jgi:exonuclease SbcC